MFGPKKIEIASMSDPRAIYDLSLLTWANEEPGLQVDAVNTLDDLYTVFDTVRSAAPTDEARNMKFSSVWPDPRDRDIEIEDIQLEEIKPIPHTDGVGRGMSAHHNVAGIVPVKLGVYLPNDEKASLNGRQMHSGRWPVLSTQRLRVGETRPGRITIFSRGGYPWLEPVMHQFSRPSPFGNEFVRYSQTRIGSPESVEKMALKALARIKALAETA